MTITKWKYQSQKYSKSINQSGIILWFPENNCCAHLQTKFTTIITRFSTSKMIKNAITWKLLFRKNRCSHWRCSVRKAVLRNFAKFTGKHLCQSVFLRKVTGLRHRTPPDDCFWRKWTFLSKLGLSEAINRQLLHSLSLGL